MDKESFTELCAPIIDQGLNWVKGMIGPSKKELQVEISELEKQIKTLSYGNQFLAQNIQQIMDIVLNRLMQSGDYFINSGNIIKIEGNTGSVQIRQEVKDAVQTQPKRFISIFNNIDEEIAKARLTMPGEEEE